MKKAIVLLVSCAMLAAMMIPGSFAAAEDSYECGMEEHTHDDSCRSAEPTCNLPVSDGHTHTDACKTARYICGLEESEEHTHSDACVVYDLTCGLEETASHAHSSDCYPYVCGKTEHQHNEDCLPVPAVTDAPQEPAPTPEMTNMLETKTVFDTLMATEDLLEDVQIMLRELPNGNLYNPESDEPEDGEVPTDGDDPAGDGKETTEPEEGSSALFEQIMACQSSEELKAVLNATTPEEVDAMFAALTKEARGQVMEFIRNYMPELFTVEYAGPQGQPGEINEADVSGEMEAQIDEDPIDDRVQYVTVPFTHVAPFVSGSQH